MISLYICRHCSKLYEYEVTACYWCSSPVKHIYVDGDKVINE